MRALIAILFSLLAVTVDAANVQLIVTTNGGIVNVDATNFFKANSNALNQSVSVTGGIDPNAFQPATANGTNWSFIATNALTDKLDTNAFNDFTLTLGTASTHSTDDYQATNVTLTLWQSHLPQQYQTTNANLTLWTAYQPSDFPLLSGLGNSIYSNATAFLLAGQATSFQPSSTTLSNIANTGALTNSSAVWQQGGTGTNVTARGMAFPLLIASRFMLIDANNNATNSSYGESSFALANWTNTVQPGSAVLSNAANTGMLTNRADFQPATANGTNWAGIPTNALTSKMDTNNFATLWATLGNAAFAALSSLQPANANLTNYAGLSTNLVVQQGGPASNITHQGFVDYPLYTNVYSTTNITLNPSNGVKQVIVLTNHVLLSVVGNVAGRSRDMVIAIYSQGSYSVFPQQRSAGWFTIGTNTAGASVGFTNQQNGVLGIELNDTNVFYGIGAVNN